MPSPPAPAPAGWLPSCTGCRVLPRVCAGYGPDSLMLVGVLKNLNTCKACTGGKVPERKRGGESGERVSRVVVYKGYILFIYKTELKTAVFIHKTTRASPPGTIRHDTKLPFSLTIFYSRYLTGCTRFLPRGLLWSAGLMLRDVDSMYLYLYNCSRR